MANPNLQVRITAKDDASAVLAKIRGEFGKMKGAVGGVLGALGPLGGSLAGFASLGGAALAIKQFVGGLDDLADTAEGVGVTAVALAELRSKAAEAGVDAAQLDNALGKLNNKVVDAASGNERAAAAFKSMGVAVRDANGNIRSTEQVLADVADKFATYANTAEKGALASELFGEKIGRKLVSYLSQGREGLRQYTGLTEDTIEQSAKLQKEIDKLANSWERLKNSVLGAAVPAINALLSVFDPDTTAQRIDYLKTLIAELERLQRTSDAPKIAAYRDELAKLQRQLSQEGTDRFIAGNRAARTELARLAPVVPNSEAPKKAAAEWRKLNGEVDAYAESLRRAMGEEANRRGVEEIRGLADAEARRVIELDRLAELEGRLTTSQRDRLGVIAQLQEAGRLTEDQVQKLTLDVYGLADATAQAKDAAADFGFTFSSALEDLIVKGGEAGDVIRALEQDILRMVTRRMVTEPTGNAVSGFLSRGGSTLAGGGSFFDAIGDAFIKVFGMASGGPVTGGHPYLIGEKGPELFVPNSSGTIVPNQRVGNSITINIAGGATRDTANQIAAAVRRQLMIVDARAVA